MEIGLKYGVRGDVDFSGTNSPPAGFLNSCDLVTYTLSCT